MRMKKLRLDNLVKKKVLKNELNNFPDIVLGFAMNLKMQMELTRQSNEDQNLVDDSVDPPEIKVHVNTD